MLLDRKSKNVSFILCMNFNGMHFSLMILFAIVKSVLNLSFNFHKL